MKEFSKLVLSFSDRLLSERLENILNREIVILDQNKENEILKDLTYKKQDDYEIDPRVIAKPEF